MCTMTLTSVERGEEKSRVETSEKNCEKLYEQDFSKQIAILFMNS